MKYFIITNNKVSVIKGVRPSNQSGQEVLKKIAGRLERLIKENPDLELTKLQALFVKKLREDGTIELAPNKIDIAHNLAISMIKQAIADRANHPLSSEKYEELITNIITTEAEDDKDFVREFFQGLLDPSITLKEKMANADKVVERLNRASKNLIPAHRSSNRSVSSNRDPHMVQKKGKDHYVETPMSVKLSKSFVKVLHGPYEPKIRYGADGKKEYQSSSICNKPRDSWYSPETGKQRFDR